MTTDERNNIVYVEPNNTSTYNSDGSSYDDNVTWKPEDLNISVDIEVVIPDRDNCGRKDYLDGKNFNQQKKFTSFFSGTPLKQNEQGKEDNWFLTDSYTNISFTQIKGDNAGSRELLGVESIDISFDANMFPQVTIKFVDVRGASLITPEEYDIDRREDKDFNGCQNFFRSLFHFPYPVFFLTVKGFYGTRETFVLSVEDFKTSFNSETGNFDVVVKFIGYKYGIYSDLPLNYLIIAPYVGGRNNEPNAYWQGNSNRNDGKFTFSDGRPIPTFIQFLEKYNRIDDAFTEALKNSNDDYNKVKRLSTLRERKNFLNEILDLKNNYELYLENMLKENQDAKIYSNGNHIILLRHKKDDIKIKKNQFSKIIKLYQDYLKKSDNEKIEGDECLNFFKKFTSEYSVSGQKVMVVGDKVYTVKSDQTSYEEINVFNGGKESSSAVFITSSMLNDINSGKEYAYVYRKYSNNGEFFSNVKTKIGEISKEIQAEMEENTETYNEVAKSVLGFSPTIENVFRMIYAHIDCYMHEFFGTLNNVQKEWDDRNTMDVTPHISIIENTDIFTKAGEVKLPPFVGYFEKDVVTGQRTKVYPFQYITRNKKHLAEVDFVEALYEGINGLSDVYETFKPKEEKGPANNERPQKFIPLTPLDIIYNGENPYSNLNASERQELLDEVVRMFVYRISTGFEINSIETNKPWSNLELKHKKDKDKDIVKDEAENIIRALGTTEKRVLLNDIMMLNNEAKYENQTVAKIKKYLTSDPTYNLNFEDVDGLKFKVTNAENLWANTKYMRNKEFDETDNIRFQKIKDYKGIRVTKTVTETSDNNVFKYFEPEKWCYQNRTFSKAGLWRKGENYPVQPGDLYYSEFCNNIIDSVNGLKKEDASIVVLPIGKVTYKNGIPSGENILNLYFDERFKSETNVYKRAEMFLSCLIGTSFPFENSANFDTESGIIRLPKFLRLFIGSQLYNNRSSETAKFCLTDDGTFTYYENCSEFFNGKTVREYETIFPNSDEEFRIWANKEFRSIDNILKDYSTDDYILNNSKGKWYSPNVEELQSALVDFYLSYDYAMYISLNKKTDFNIPYNPIIFLIDELYKKLEKDSDIENVETKINESENTYDTEEDADRLKEEIYYTQKGLYDKWLSVFTEDLFKLRSPMEDKLIMKAKTSGRNVNEKITEFNNYVFIDSFYNDIGQTFYVDAKILYDLIIEQIGEATIRSNRSVLQFITDIAEKNKLLFLTLPVYTNFYKRENMVDIFTPHSPYDESRSAGYRSAGNTYILMYTHEVSHNVNPGDENKNGTDYKDDGVSIADAKGNITDDCKETLAQGNLEKYTVPSFGVTFGRQNQSYFKSISVNMENPRQTDFAIYNQFMLAAQEKNGDVNSPVTVGQNMYSIYSNRAYDCNVEMMGCVNIIPTMYFQLNNVPLFRGAYMITKVEHHIKAGDMTTKFSGTRISKNAIPYLKCAINMEEMVERINGGALNESFNEIEKQNEVNEVYSSEEKLSKYFSLEEMIRSEKATANNITEQFEPDPNIIANLKILTAFLDELREYLGYGISVTSGYRCPRLNKLLGGVDNSAHKDGFAADIVPANGKVKMKEFKQQVMAFCKKYKESGRKFDQYIDEKNKRGSEWVHIGITNSKGERRCQFLKTTDGSHYEPITNI